MKLTLAVGVAVRGNVTLARLWQMLRTQIIAALVLIGYAAADKVCSSRCASDLDCSLNGKCNATSGLCACLSAWTGPCCTALALEPVDIANGPGYRARECRRSGQVLCYALHKTMYPCGPNKICTGNTSTWGGNIIPAGGQYHMWIAEMAPNGTAGSGGSCGLTTWSSNSQITHVVSANPLGPYERRDVAVGVWR